jgi:hypothetical protein
MCTEGCKRNAIASRVLQSPDKGQKRERLLLSPVGQAVADQLMDVPVHDGEIKFLQATRCHLSGKSLVIDERGGNADTADQSDVHDHPRVSIGLNSERTYLTLAATTSAFND